MGEEHEGACRRLMVSSRLPRMRLAARVAKVLLTQTSALSQPRGGAACNAFSAQRSLAAAVANC
jgi:hypothetical protein